METTTRMTLPPLPWLASCAAIQTAKLERKIRTAMHANKYRFAMIPSRNFPVRLCKCVSIRRQEHSQFCHSERSEESLLLCSNRREILRFAQNDKIIYCFASALHS